MGYRTTRKQMKAIVVKQDAEAEVPTEILAQSIIAIADGIKKLRSGRLNDRALYLLVQNATPMAGGKYNKHKVGLVDIQAIFEGIDNLKAAFIRKPDKV